MERVRPALLSVSTELPQRHFATVLQGSTVKKYGDISNVTDKGYYTNSYHVDVREKIDAFTKFKIESEFQNKSLGGAISYVEVPNRTNNVEAHRGSDPLHL